MAQDERIIMGHADLYGAVTSASLYLTEYTAIPVFPHVADQNVLHKLLSNLLIQGCQTAACGGKTGLPGCVRA